MMTTTTVKGDTPGRIQVSQQTPNDWRAVQSLRTEQSRAMVFFFPRKLLIHITPPPHLPAPVWWWRWRVVSLRQETSNYSWHNRTGTSQQQGWTWRGLWLTPFWLFVSCCLVVARPKTRQQQQQQQQQFVSRPKNTQRFSSRLVFFPFCPFGLEKLVSETALQQHVLHMLRDTEIIPVTTNHLCTYTEFTECPKKEEEKK